MDLTLVALLLVVASFVALAALAVRFVPEGCNAIVERRGSLDRVLEPGWHLLLPGIERVAHRVKMGGRVVSVRSQGLTNDRRPIAVSGAVFFQVLEPDKAIDYVDALDDAAADLTVRTTEAFVGELESAALLKRQRKDINDWLLGLLNQSSTQWGVRITRIELDFSAPKDASD